MKAEDRALISPPGRIKTSVSYAESLSFHLFYSWHGPLSLCSQGLTRPITEHATHDDDLAHVVSIVVGDQQCLA